MAPPKAEVDLEHVPTRVAFAGHLGHLTPDQERALEQFKQELAKNGYFQPEQVGKPASVDDVTLTRFLRARKFEVAGAYAQFTSAEDWRRNEHVDELYDNFDIDEFESARELYPQWTGRRDHSGLPVYVFEVGSLTKEKTDPYSKDASRLEPRIVALYEHMVQFVLPFCSAVPHAHEETPISGSATLVDISGVSLQRFWALKGHMQRASTLANARYAETLGAIYLIGAPSFFSVVWGWVQKWFDEGTRNKIHILSAADLTSALSAHMPASSIPRKYGGTLDWTFGRSGPNLDAESRETLGMKEGEELPKGPLRWRREGGGLTVVKGSGRSKEERDKWDSRGRKQESAAKAPVSNGHAGDSADPGAQDTTDAVATPSPSPAVSTSSTSAQEPVLSSPTPASSIPSAPIASAAPIASPSQTAEPTLAAEPSPAAAPANGETLPPPILGLGYSNETAHFVEPTAHFVEPTAQASNGVESVIKGATGTAAVEGHDIHVAARENAGAPIKDLAATLEGTTL